jgi:hypothetical protein
MLTVKQCRKYLKNDYSDKEVEKIRNNLYDLADLIIGVSEKCKDQ